jgi:hypothetical protein
MGESKSGDLRAPRGRLGATVELMAIGLGLDVSIVNDIEAGTASDDLRDRYAEWLTIMEGWLPDKRRIELLVAVKGRRFMP